MRGVNIDGIDDHHCLNVFSFIIYRNIVLISQYMYFIEQPTVVFVVCQTTSATVLWKSEMNGASTQTFFVKFWSPSQSSQATLTPAISDPGSDADVQHTINNLVPETIYIFQIIARNLFGDSLSKSVNCTTNERRYFL
jgi:hypothetical protein